MRNSNCDQCSPGVIANLMESDPVKFDLRVRFVSSNPGSVFEQNRRVCIAPLLNQYSSSLTKYSVGWRSKLRRTTHSRQDIAGAVNELAGDFDCLADSINFCAKTGHFGIKRSAQFIHCKIEFCSLIHPAQPGEGTMRSNSRALSSMTVKIGAFAAGISWVSAWRSTIRPLNGAGILQ